MKASDNPFPSLLVAEGSAPASPAAGDQRLFIDSADHKLKRKDSSGTVTTVEGGTSGGGGVLASTSWFPATNTDVVTTSTTYADVNATNAAITFTAPTSGTVIVVANFSFAVGTATVLMIDLREGTSDLTNTATRVGFLNLPGVTGAAGHFRTSIRWKVTGLTSGSSHTYKLGLARASGTDNASVEAGPSWGALEMDVLSA